MSTECRICKECRDCTCEKNKTPHESTLKSIPKEHGGISLSDSLLPGISRLLNNPGGE